MKHQSGKLVIAAALLLSLCSAHAQDITADEMIQIEKLRTELTAKGVNVTPEMETRMLQRIRAVNALNQGGGPALLMRMPTAPNGLFPQPATSAALTPAALPAISEDELKAKVTSLDPGRPINEMSILKDGLMVDGKRFADPEGRATRFATDAVTGRVGYVVSGARPDLSTFKIARVDKPADAITVGQLRRQGDSWQFTSATGKSLSGELFFPLTDGVLLMRDSVGFKYVAGEGVQQVNVPSGWLPASIQRGNISTTGWMLLEKASGEANSNPFSVFSKLGQLAGVVNANEYALLQMSTGKLVEIDIASDGKNAYSYSQCRRKNAVVNVCDKMTSYESAFNPDGTPNPTHYLWKVDWQRTPTGAILLALEGTLGGRLSGVDLETGKKVALYERALGVVLQSARVTPDGKLSVAVRLGLSGESMDDVAKEIQGRPAVAPSAGSKTQP